MAVSVSKKHSLVCSAWRLPQWPMLIAGLLLCNTCAVHLAPLQKHALPSKEKPRVNWTTAVCLLPSLCLTEECKEERFKGAEATYSLLCDDDGTLETLLWGLGWGFWKERKKADKSFMIPIVSGKKSTYIFWHSSTFEINVLFLKYSETCSEWFLLISY